MAGRRSAPVAPFPMTGSLTAMWASAYTEGGNKFYDSDLTE
jgi:hypothetical protein